MSDSVRAWVFASALCAAVFAADQAAKAAIEANLVLGEKVEVLGPLSLTLSHNRGIAFGLAGGAGAGLVLVSLAALGVIAYLFARNATKPGVWMAVGLLAGGALGNLADRVRADKVTDYIDVGSWPAFNLADVAITCGVVLLVLLFVREAEAAAGDG